MKLNLGLFIPILVKFLPIFKWLLRIFIRVFPIFERFVPFFVSYFLERALRTLKAGGSIDDYRTRTVRTRRFYYRVDVRLVMTSEQAKTMLNKVVTRILGMFESK